MRRFALLALALVVVACSRDRSGSPAVSSAPSSVARPSGPDLLVLRLPLAGGSARAYVYPQLDSAVWTSAERVPPIERVLGFDPSAGSVVAVDAKGQPIRVDLRLNTVERASSGKLAHLASKDGSSVFGIAADGRVRRFAPNDSGWVFKPPSSAREIYPQPDGSLFVLADRGSNTVIWHLRPPLNRVEDSVVVPKAGHAIGTQVGDRFYLTVPSGLIGLRSRDLKNRVTIDLPHPASAVVTTPSGDRIYAAAEGSPELYVVDRYSGSRQATIELPGEATDLRMDPTGRYVLARPAKGDSAWVVAVGTDRRTGSTATSWRNDLPTVLPDGGLVLLRGPDVVFVDGETFRPRATVAGGAKDEWLFVAWNGFHRRAEVQSPTLAQADTAAKDSSSANNPFASQVPGQDSVKVADTSTAAPRDTAKSAAPPSFVVQFAALRNEGEAKDIAKAVNQTTEGARVVSTVRDGITIFRVILGPYSSRADAERAAKASGRSYWIYEGAP